MKLTIIAAHDLNLGIGYQNQLPWRLPADLAFFKSKTFGKPILMGRKTFESIGKPLPGRQNIVVSGQGISIAGVDVIQDLKQLSQFSFQELIICGGSSIYQYFLPFADEMIITIVEAKCQVDAYFPDYEKSAFKENHLGVHPADEKNQYIMVFKQYIRY